MSSICMLWKDKSKDNLDFQEIARYMPVMTGGYKTQIGISPPVTASGQAEQVQDLQAEEPRLVSARCDVVNFGCFGAMKKNRNRNQ